MKILISNKQKKIVHMAARRLGLIDRQGCKTQYVLVLKNVCGVNSSTKLDQVGYDRLIAWFRSQGINIGSSVLCGKGGFAPGISTRQLYRINQLIVALPDINLPGVIKQSTGVAQDLEVLASWEARKLIEALTAIKSRRTASLTTNSHEGSHE